MSRAMVHIRWLSGWLALRLLQSVLALAMQQLGRLQLLQILRLELLEILIGHNI